MNKDLKEFFQEAPEFLSMLGFTNAFYDENKDAWINEYMPSEKLTHSNGTIIQGGFVTGWIDAIMALACMAKCGSDVLVLTLEIKISFLNSARIGEIISTAKVIKNTKSIAFLEGKIENTDGSLIATGTCTAKLKHNFYKN